MNNHCKITFADLRDVIERHCLDLISKAQMYEDSQANSCKISVDLRMPRILKVPVEIERSEDEISVTFTIFPRQDASVAECRSVRFIKFNDRVYRTNYTFDSSREFKLNTIVNDIHPLAESIVLLMLYQRLAYETEKNKSNDIHVEIDEEEYEKRSTYIKNSCTVNSFTDDGTLDSFIHLTSDDGLFTLELNATEVNGDKKDEYDCTTLASTVIRMSDYSDKEFFLNHIKNILSREFPKATEGIFSQYYDSIPREPDLATKIGNILKEAGVDESKLDSTALAIIDTILDPENEE